MNGLFKLIRGMDLQKMGQTAKKTARESGKPTAVVFCDMVWCGLRYGAGYTDYALFQMWDKTAAQRRTILTRGRNNQYVRALNDPEARKIFAQKPRFLSAFAPYVRRRWLDLTTSAPEDLEAMLRDLGRVLVKPADATHGDGVEIIHASDVTDPSALYQKLLERGQTLCEEVIAQHPDLDRLWPGSVNTVRLVTIYHAGAARVVSAALRVGGGEKPVDNFNNGGMVVPLDLSDGRAAFPAVDKAGRRYDAHPGTGVPFVGFAVPCWPDCLALVREAAAVVPAVGYVAWDVAVTPTGPLLVEGNDYPGHDIYGLPGQTADGAGVLPALEAAVPLRALKKQR